MNCVKYSENCLIISIPTRNPALTHWLMMKALAIAMRDCKKDEPDALASICDLQLLLLPDELQLEKAFE